MRSWLPAGWLLLALSLPACGDTGVAAIRLDVNEELGGTITTTSLLVPDGPGPLEGRVVGAKWGERANLYSARGSFAKLSELKVADITFKASMAGINTLQVILPRGETAQWPTALTPARNEREQVQETFDPQGQFSGATTHLTLEVTLPGRVISAGVIPEVRGVAVETSGRKATLVLPVDRGTSGSDAFEWHVTWK